MVNMEATQPQAPPPLPRDRLGDLQRTKPPTFSHAMEQMDDDDWLKSTEKKLQVAQCNNHEKVLASGVVCSCYKVFHSFGMMNPNQLNGETPG
jgi:hypothetical protein